MEKEISRRAILGNYIRSIEWGKDIFGIKEALETYLNKKPSKLILNKSVRLAAVMSSPLGHKPNTNSRMYIEESVLHL